MNRTFSVGDLVKVTYSCGSFNKLALICKIDRTGTISVSFVTGGYGLFEHSSSLAVVSRV